MTSTHETVLKSYQKHLKDDIKSILDNFMEIMILAKVDTDKVGNNVTPNRAQEHYEMTVRASNMIRAQESLMKLIYNIKQFLIINDFPLINDAISNSQNTNYKVEGIDMSLINLRNEISNELFILEEEYYSSFYK
jgi:mediator of RNA polymerase II transcription subunit 22